MSDTPRRHRIVPVRMTDEEHASAVGIASELGISLSRLMRSRARDLPPSRVDLETAKQLTRIGVNLNQIAHQLHTGFGPDLEGLSADLESLREMVIDLRGQLRSRG